VKREKIEQAWANRQKVIRAAIRLRHSIAADNEINETIDVERRKFEAAVQRGVLPAPLDPKVLSGN
jgi:hypothetical protein